MVGITNNVTVMPQAPASVAKPVEKLESTTTAVKFETAAPVQPTNSTKETVGKKVEGFRREDSDGQGTFVQEFDQQGNFEGRVPAKKVVEAYEQNKKDA